MPELIIDSIYKLDGHIEATAEEFGSKIHLLSCLLRENAPVPHGFFMSFKPTFGATELSIKSRDQLRNAYHEIAAEEGTRLIVRSSASVEDNINHQFSGLFKSHKNVSTFEDLCNAIQVCHASRDSDVITLYAARFGITISTIRVAILVQLEITPAISGLAHLKFARNNPEQADYLEVVENDMEGLIVGSKTPVVFDLKYGSKPSLKPRSTPQAPIVATTSRYAAEIANAFANIKSVLLEDTLVEFCIESGNGIKILQARPYRVAGADPIRKTLPALPERQNATPPETIFENEKKWGLKGAAMVRFNELKLFSAPFEYLEPQATLARIKVALERLAKRRWPAGLTIRYSYGNEIGLPRLFVANADQAYKKIQETRKPEYFTIVHGYLEVARSYELLLDDNYLVLEHVPGLWESNNTLEPDVMILDGTRGTLLKVRESRRKLLAGPTFLEHKEEPPPGYGFLMDRFRKVLDTCRSSLGDAFRANYPLNFHFVETPDGEFSFLNIRRMSRMNRRFVRGGAFFHVSKIEDLSSWDQRTPILLRVITQRGQERSLIDLAEALPKNVPVHTTFGYLSHPALLFREFGVDIVPAYFDREIFEFEIPS